MPSMVVTIASMSTLMFTNLFLLLLFCFAESYSDGSDGDFDDGLDAGGGDAGGGGGGDDFGGDDFGGFDDGVDDFAHSDMATVDEHGAETVEDFGTSGLSLHA